MSTRPQPHLRQRLWRPGAVLRGVQQRLQGSRLAPPRQFAGGPLHVQRGRPTVVVVGLIGVSLVTLSFLTAWLVWTSAYVGVALVRAGVRRVRRGERSGTTAERGMGGVRESSDA